MCRGFGKAEMVKLDYGDSVLGSSQFLLLPQLPQKMMLAPKVVKIVSKQSSHFVSLPKVHDTLCTIIARIILCEKETHKT